MNPDQAAADIAAENVRLVLSGVLRAVLPGTLAHEVLECLRDSPVDCL